jgi:serine/threonine-protein kinase
MRHLLLAVAVLAFFGATVGTAFGMTSSSSNDRHTTAQHASQPPSTAPSADQSAQEAATGDQTGQTNTTGQNGQTDPNTNSGHQNGNGNNNGTTTVKVTVPWVKDQNETYARNKLKDAGLVAWVKYVCVDGVDPGVVTEQSPNGDTQADKDSKVSLKVQGVKVPSVVGATKSDATSQLEQAGLKVSAKGGDGAVTKQSPSAGSCVKQGSTVTIYGDTPVTNGSTASPSPAPAQQ